LRPVPKGGKGGMGVRHTLFPRLPAIWRSASLVVCHRLPVSRRCVDLHGHSRSFSAPQRSRPLRVLPRRSGLLGEASWPCHRRACRHALARPGLDVFADIHYRTIKVHILAFVRKVGTGHGSHGRLPCATGLASYPSSCVWSVCKQATAVFAAPPAFRILLPIRRCRRGFSGFRPSGSIRECVDLFSRFRLRGRKPFDGVFHCPKPSGSCSHTGSQ